MTPADQLTTRSSGGLFGGLSQMLGTVFQTVGDVAKTAIPPAVDLYKLKLANEAAKTGLATQQTALDREVVAAGQARAWAPWMTYAALGVAALVALLIIRRK